MNTNISQQELDLLAGYPSEIEQRDPDRYNYLGQSVATLCRIKDRSMALFDKRYRAAREVIDLIARQVGSVRGHPSRQKAKLKRRIKELEDENAVLRSLIVK